MNNNDGPEAAPLLARAAGGDVDAWGAILARYQQRLQSLISVRLDPRLRRRLDLSETAQVLGMQERAASKRYLPALERLREFLAEMPGGLTGLRP